MSISGGGGRRRPKNTTLILELVRKSFPTHRKRLLEKCNGIINIAEKVSVKPIVDGVEY